MKMIERVARASFACWRKSMDDLGLHLDKSQEFEGMSERELAFAYENARTMIAAMREPTRGMIIDGSLDAGASGVDEEYTLEAWQAMIDAALKED